MTKDEMIEVGRKQHFVKTLSIFLKDQWLCMFDLPLVHSEREVYSDKHWAQKEEDWVIMSPTLKTDSEDARCSFCF